VSRLTALVKAGPVLALAALLPFIAGCTLSSHSRQEDPGVTLTSRVASSAFVAVVPGTRAPDALGPSLSRIVAATARPGEDLELLRAGPKPDVLVAANAPPPATVVIPRKPAAPEAGATAYQQATYHNSLMVWQGEVASARRELVARTAAAMSSWAANLAVQARVGSSAGAETGPGNLAAECAVADDALDGLQQLAGGAFGGRQVIMAYADSLDGVLPAGELDGDQVIIVTSFLPSAAAASQAQASLLAAGATWAVVLGPEATGGQLAQLVSVGLGSAAATQTLSGSALFANDSSVLLPGAVRVLTPLLTPLREPGSVAVINGYASTPGSAAMNFRLSYARAAAVAGFLEAHGIPASSLIVIGHGASNLVAPGPSAANRRVTVVIEDPTAYGLPS
jgi:outer membrane protein OmpA-like peptidoglycan-associated protein